VLTRAEVREKGERERLTDLFTNLNGSLLERRRS
jgi:hypothetical protein